MQKIFHKLGIHSWILNGGDHKWDPNAEREGGEDKSSRLDLGDSVDFHLRKDKQLLYWRSFELGVANSK